MMKITGLSHLFKWENLHNWWLTKYFFVPLYVCHVCNAINFFFFFINTKICKFTETAHKCRVFTDWKDVLLLWPKMMEYFKSK